MKLRTTVPVTHLDVNSLPLATSKSGIIIMEIDDFLFSAISGIQIPFKIIDDVGNIIPSKKWPDGVFKIPVNNSIDPSFTVEELSRVIRPLVGTTDNIYDGIWAEIEVQAKLELVDDYEELNNISQIETI